MFSMPAIPVTTVQKMTGAMIILIRRMNPSPRGFILAPTSGMKVPSRMPMTIAQIT